MILKRLFQLAIVFTGGHNVFAKEWQLEKCYHRVLGVKPSINKTNAIKRAYRKMAKHVHPDKNKGAANLEKFHLLNEALEFLLVPHNRMRLREFLKKEENQKKCGWRFDHPWVGSAFDWSWWALQSAGKAGKDAIVMIGDAGLFG